MILVECLFFQNCINLVRASEHKIHVCSVLQKQQDFIDRADSGSVYFNFETMGTVRDRLTKTFSECFVKCYWHIKTEGHI